MKVYLSIFVLLGLLAVQETHVSVAQSQVGGICVPPPAASLKMTLNPQQQGNWCWAASGQMIMGYLGKTVQQCTEANIRFGRSDCCTNPSSTQCNEGGWPQFDKFGFTFETTSNAPLPWSTVRTELGGTANNQICSVRPFAFSWRWTNGGGHMMVATGYYTINGVNWINVDNPLPVGVGNSTAMTYDEYVSGSDHTHWDDYYDIR